MLILNEHTDFHSYLKEVENSFYNVDNALNIPAFLITGGKQYNFVNILYFIYFVIKKTGVRFRAI